MEGNEKLARANIFNDQFASFATIEEINRVSVELEAGEIHYD